MNIPYRVIKLLAFVTGFCIVPCTTALAQQSLFVYLQSENQPFYVQMGDKVYSSSAIGHLVISGLADKTCNLEIGFPQHNQQPQRFSIPLRNKDHGYQLVKNSRGWALYDWQTDETIKPLKEAGNSSLLYGERKKDDAFATLMAAVVNDSAVLYTSIVKQESVTVPSVATTDAKPEEQQPVVKPEEKPKTVDAPVTEKKVETVTVKTEPATADSPLTKNDPVVALDTASSLPKPADTLVTKYDPKEKGLNEKPVIAGVAKIQQQTKDGETKMVFIDSSETPAKVVTVYINEEKTPADEKQPVQTQVPVQPVVTQPVDNTPAANVVKNEPKKEEPASQPAKQEPAETVKKEEPAKETAKETAVLTKEEKAEQIKKETWRPAPEKKAAAGDTVTIILESRQMKKSTTAAEEAQPLFRPKQEPKTEPVKPVTKPVDTTVIQMDVPAKQIVNTAATEKEEKKEVKLEPAKPATEDKPVVKTEPAKADIETKKENEPAPGKNDKEEKLVRTETESKPSADTVKKAVMKPVTETAAQPSAIKNTAEPENPKAVEPEKKTETGNKLVMINSDCVKLATENDVDKMRVKMLAESDLQKKLAVANKSFKTMCLYARQIKALSELFPTDETKYKFLELAYPFAADTANFKQLHELLTDEVYVTKFKKLVRLQ